MRLAEVNHEAFDFNDGLESIKLTGLKRIVLLAGPNGSGKTRLLKRIASLGGLNCVGFSAESHTAVVSQCVASGSFEQAGGKYRLKTPTWPVSHFAIGVKLSEPVHSVARDKVVVCSFVPNQVQLIDPAESTQSTVRQAVERVSAILGTQNIGDKAALYIQSVVDKWFNANSELTRCIESERQAANVAFDSLNLLVTQLLDTGLSRSIDGDAELFGRRIDNALLSEGQKVLLCWAVALHAQNVGLGKAILVLDEPENHLHPEVLNRVIQRIIEVNSDGQVWISTHSVTVIASLMQHYRDELSLYYLENGRASFAGRSPENVLRSLIGGPENIAALREFIDLPDIMATNRFAAECLIAPKVIESSTSDDPQARIAQHAVMSVSSSALRRVRVLDFGAGAGRVLECLSSQHPTDLARKLDYVAWDQSESYRSKCQSNIDVVYGGEEVRWFKDSNVLFNSFSRESFDVVLMCNVLHEIDPRNWPSALGKDSLVAGALKETGQLLLVEDYLMPIGEYSHSYGFIVLETDAIQELVGSQVQVVHAEGKYAGRIKGHLISKQQLANVTAESRSKALRVAVQNAKTQIEAVRAEPERSFRSGQRHAFWVQQFANLSLALSQLA
jgi:energy-coupling factor transporter ATP-binding protein EcfA2/SAM-dependent methyltransferase